MANVDCDVIKDILPIYVENMASDATKKLVGEHLVRCEACRKAEQSMRGTVVLPKNTDAAALRSVSNKLFQNRFFGFLLAVLSACVCAVLLATNLNAPIMIPYETMKECIGVSEKENGELELSVLYPNTVAEVEYGVDNNGAGIAIISCYTTKWLQKFGSAFSELHVTLDTKREDVPEYVYYSPTENGEAVCIYKAGTTLPYHGSGLVILPSLTLNIWTLLSVLLTVTGGVFCIALRRRKKMFSVALTITTVPAMYAVSSLLVLSGRDDIYNVMYYFSKILLLTALLSVICWSAIWIVRQKKSARRSA
ncbi:MAG: zf-HC2 domain-containing protein [Lachnospiraceae bacterium]